MRDEVPITRTVILPQQRTAVATFSGRLADMIESAHESALYYVTGSLTWSDDTTPRTERPVRFNAGLHQYADAGFGSLRATYRYSPSFTYRA